MTPTSPALRAGTGRRCVNPPPHISHGGWGAQRHEQAEGIDMDFWATALALSDGNTTALVLDIDIQILTNERADQIRSAVSRATGLPAENIRACATHTHSGPTPYKSWIEKGYELVDPWFENLARLVRRGGRRCRGQPAAGHCSLRTRPMLHQHQPPLRDTRRRALSGHQSRRPVRPRGSCVALDGLDRQPVATLVNYACHPTIMGPANRLLTPDYPGAMKRVVEQAMGGRCLFLQGAAGDQGPVQGFQADTRSLPQFGRSSRP